MFDGIPQIVHPDRVVDEANFARLLGHRPGLSPDRGTGARQPAARGGAGAAKLPRSARVDQPARSSAAAISRRSREALNRLHQPVELTDILPDGPYWSRLAFDELLAGQLALALVRAQLRRPAGDRHAGDGHLRNKIIDALPYALTASQRQAAAAIAEDLRQPVRMLRLLQGDVGSGKTVVALLAAAAVAEAGRQAALMAPTEILARQHIKTIAPLAERAGLRVAILTGREKGKERRDLLARLAAGEIDLLVGTHALIQDDVVFKALALAVVDEQHRFGVRERLALTAKGEAVDVLVLSATPIPRTLVLTYFGDMDVSELREKPAGPPADRYPRGAGQPPRRGDGRRRPRAVGGQAGLLDLPAGRGVRSRGRRSSDQRHRAVRKPAAALRRHGRPRPWPDEGRREGPRDGAVRRARDRAAGRDDRGRGRRRRARRHDHGDRERRALRARATAPVARPDRPRRGSLDLPAALPRAAERDVEGAAQVIRETTDGFRIAEEDLRLRGEGDVLGVRQSGLPGYRIARSDVHGQLISQARDEALRIMKDNPRLAGARGEALRCLLYLFERDEAIPLIGAG